MTLQFLMASIVIFLIFIVIGVSFIMWDIHCILKELWESNSYLNQILKMNLHTSVKIAPPSPPTNKA